MSSLSQQPSAGLPFAGQLVVFTGKLSTLGRRDARALVSRLGGDTADDVNARTTVLVVGAEGFASKGGADDVDKSHKIKRAEELNAQGSAIEIITEEEFCRRGGRPTPDSLKRQYHPVRDLLARYTAVREDHLRYLVKYGVIKPVLRTNADTFFAFGDVAIIRQANESLQQGLSFRSVVRSLMASRHGQLAFDFRLEAEPARVVALQRPTRPPAQKPKLSSQQSAARDAALAEDYFRAGSALDERHEDAEAAAAYRKALELDPYLVPALINLANIHYGRDELVEAQALYERAIGLEPDFYEAHFNLGNIYHDLGRFPEAQVCYRESLRLNPTYAEGHFYLAVTLEKMGLSQEAKPHWRVYQQLAPHGEWVELAREFSE